MGEDHSLIVFRLEGRVLLYASFTYRMAHAMAFVNPVVDNWLEREIALKVHHEESIHERTLYHYGPLHLLR